jgi:hypothetical protein
LARSVGRYEGHPSLPGSYPRPSSKRPPALGTVAAEPKLNERGERLIWLEERQLDKPNSIRRSGESYSEAIIRLAALREGHWTHKRR